MSWTAAVLIVQDTERYGGGHQLQHNEREKRERVLVAPKLFPNLNNLYSLGSRPPGLKILMLNTRLVNVETAIQDLILDDQANLAYITETWLDKAGGSHPALSTRVPCAAASRSWGAGECVWSCRGLS